MNPNRTQPQVQMIEPKRQVQLTEIENGWLVGIPPLSHPQTGQVIRPGVIQHVADYHELCECLKQFFPPIVQE